MEFLLLHEGCTGLSLPIQLDVKQDLQLSKKERRFLNAKDGMTVVCQFLGEYY
jgi:hypothetical protein